MRIGYHSGAMASFRTVMVACTGFAAVGLAIWQGCAVYDTSLLLDASPSDAASDINVLPDAGDGCNHRTVPGRPAADDDASTDSLDFFNAIQYLDFGAGDGGVTGPLEILGYDLDGVCTCPGPDSCIVFPDAGKQCDYEGGVDNSAGTLIREFAGAQFFDQAFINQGIGQGIFGALFRIEGYNGQANDTKVSIYIFTSNGTQGVGTDAGPMLPQFKGNDTWTLDPSGLLGGVIGDAGPTPPSAYDLGAYVTNYTLVANISDMPLAIGAGNGIGLVTIELSDAKVIAKLTPFGNGQFQASGTVTGRWETRKLLTSLQVLNDPLQVDASLCGADSTYQLLKPRICGYQDIAKYASEDETGAPCDALSLGFNFTSVPAKYGSIVAKPDGGGGCGPTWTDQCGP
jgi:hypothetical protein